MIQLPKKEESFWREFYPREIYPPLKQDIETDSVIIGAGITGLSAAYLLKQAGQKVVVLEKGSVGSGTTGRTTGKVTSQHGLIYDRLVNQHGMQKTRQYAVANQKAVGTVRDIIKKENIDCDWASTAHYVYTTQPAAVKELKREAGTAARLGLPATFENDTSLPFKVAGAVRFSAQGKFNSQKYLLGLAKVVRGKGSYVFENSEAIIIRDGAHPYVRTKHATVHANSIVVATHVPTFPLVGRFSYGFLEYPTESFLVAGPLPKTVPGTYISPQQDRYSIFPINASGQRVILIGGEGGNIPGLRLNKDERYQRLADFAQKHFGVREITHKWSDMDYRGYDNLPLVGKLYPWSRHTYTGTGYMKWGMTNGTAAAMMIKNMILGEPNPYLPAFDSVRSGPVTSMPKALIKQLFS